MRRPAWSCPSVIIAKEKHDTLYLDATTEEKFHASAVGLLRQRFDAGHWYPEPEDEAGKQPTIDLSEESAALLPRDSAVYNLHARQIRQLKLWEREVASAREWRANASAALEARDGELAWACLLERADAEYEHVKLEPLL